MTPLLAPASAGALVYPDSDGEPMSDNTKQARWITVFHGNLEVLLREVLAFVAMKLLWYAREHNPEQRAAPDIFVAFGRPRGDRGSYRQWEEDGIAPQVVIEVRSPGNSDDAMAKKHIFYSEHGVEDYFIYDPYKNYLQVFRRQGTALIRQHFGKEYTCPRLGIRFDLTGDELRVFYPDGRRFLTFEELEAERAREVQLRLAAERKLRAAEDELRTTAQRAIAAEQRAARLAELSGKLLEQQATPDELLELRQLLSARPPVS